MKNNTKVRLHLSKQLFESLAKQVITESKKNFGAGMEEVKVKKDKKEKAPEVKATDKMKSMEEMETRVAEKKEKVEEVAEPIQQLLSDPETFKSFLQSLAILGTSGAAIAGFIKLGVKKMASKLKKDPKYAGKSDDEIEKMIGAELTGKVQKTAGGSGEGGILPEKKKVEEFFGLGKKITVPDKNDPKAMVKAGKGDYVVYNQQPNGENEGTYEIVDINDAGVSLKVAPQEYQAYGKMPARDFKGTVVDPKKLSYYGKK
jgi:hypothetical protein